jgi:hypothetical protein
MHHAMETGGVEVRLPPFLTSTSAQRVLTMVMSSEIEEAKGYCVYPEENSTR